MTPSKYLFFRIASRFGYARKHVRLGHAASESLLLKEAETFLGEAIWRKVENIEELSMQYWNLRKLAKDHERISREIDQLQGEFQETHLQRTESRKTASDSLQDLTEERKQVFAQIDKLTRDRDRIVAKARDIRRTYHGLKIKQDVLSKEGDKLGEIQKTSERLTEIRSDFDKLKQDREKIAQDISTSNARAQEIVALIGEQKKSGKSKSTESNQSIGDANQQISARRAQINSLNTQMRQLYAEIGRHVSLSAPSVPAFKQAAKDHRGLVDVMAALRKSIQYNWKLAELS
jgi:chromosome segregation ATPase